MELSVLFFIVFDVFFSSFRKTERLYSLHSEGFMEPFYYINSYRFFLKKKQDTIHPHPLSLPFPNSCSDVRMKSP